MNKNAKLEMVECTLESFPAVVSWKTDYFDQCTEETTTSYALHCACYNEHCPSSIIELLLKKYPAASKDRSSVGERWLSNYHGGQKGLPLHYYLSRPLNYVDLDMVKVLVEAYPQSLLLTTDSECLVYPIHVVLYQPADLKNIMVMSATDDNNDKHGGGGDMISSKKECTSCEQTEEVIITEGINSIAIQDDMSTCANCGKEGNSNNMNTCNKCKMVKYCNAACKKKHRSKHKKACERRVAELHDIELFKDPPPPDECPICMLILPGVEQSDFKSCCGKIICMGCIHVMIENEGGELGLCAFCRTPPVSSDEEEIERIHNLMKKDNANAHYVLAGYYARGWACPSQDREESIKECIR